MFLVVDLWKNVLISPSQLGRHYEQVCFHVLSFYASLLNDLSFVLLVC